jgi:hypothetical protein
MKRSRGRGRRQQNPVNRSYDSNGPDVRVRGTASQVFEKYQALARDAMSAGDRVMAENYLQHAEHYFRILQSFQPQPSENDDADASNGVSEETQSGDGNGAANGDGDDDNGAEPLVLVRESDDGEKDAPKSRRRGPLGKKRKAKSEEAEAAPTSIEAEAGGDAEAVHSGE